MSSQSQSATIDLESGTRHVHRYPPTQSSTSATTVLTKIHIDYGSAPNLFSTKLPHELNGRIAPAEFTRRITILNQEISSRPLEDQRLVVFFWMILASIPLIAINVASSIIIYAASSLTIRIAAVVITAATTGVLIAMLMKWNNYTKTPYQSAKIAADLMKGWSDLDTERRLLWISNRNARPHPRRTLAPWTIEIHELAMPPSFDSTGEVIPSYATAERNARVAPAPGHATQPNA
ncbi:hypothetical protein HDU96_005597 [Phlyctochytrium bullatum]|nr:hypothetical protein HDU96_005597 [Phlyctochytrium bullatum]